MSAISRDARLIITVTLRGGASARAISRRADSPRRRRAIPRRNRFGALFVSAVVNAASGTGKYSAGDRCLRYQARIASVVDVDEDDAECLSLSPDFALLMGRPLPRNRNDTVITSPRLTCDLIHLRHFVPRRAHPRRTRQKHGYRDYAVKATAFSCESFVSFMCLVIIDIYNPLRGLIRDAGI